MSVLLALAIIVAIIAVVCTVKAVRSVAKVAPCADLTTHVATKHHADVVTSVVDIVNPDCTEAVVMVLAYTKASLKKERLNGRRARARAWHINNCVDKEATRIKGAAKRMEITMRDQQRGLGRTAQKALVREAQVQGISLAKLLARKAEGAAQRAANAARKQSAVRQTKAKAANQHLTNLGILSITADGHKVVVTPASKQAVKPVRIYVRRAANKPTIVSGAQLGQQARATSTNLATQIRVAKATLASLYAILPLARQVVGLSNKASRKVGMYTWLADEGHVGVRSTKSSVARRDAAQEIVCSATLAAEAFKETYGIEAAEVVSQILAVKAIKSNAVEMLRDHKAEQHRLFLERQERRAAKAALKAAKGAPAASPAVTEVADWEKYVPVNCGNKAIASNFLGIKTATVAQKAAAIAAINGASPDHHLVGKCTADAAYGVAA